MDEIVGSNVSFIQMFHFIETREMRIILNPGLHVHKILRL